MLGLIWILVAILFSSNYFDAIKSEGYFWSQVYALSTGLSFVFYGIKMWLYPTESEAKHECSVDSSRYQNFLYEISPTILYSVGLQAICFSIDNRYMEHFNWMIFGCLIYTIGLFTKFIEFRIELDKHDNEID